MSPQAQLEAFAQKVHLTIKNRYFDDITSEDGVVFVAQVIDWTNMFLDELENEVGTDGSIVDWYFSREAEYTLGTATLGGASTSVPSAIDHLITDENRYVQVKQGDSVVSNWLVVHPGDISSKTDRITEDMCAVVGTNLVFSRAFKDTESTGTIVGDVILKLPRLSSVNVKALATVRPQQLLILGVAKNATLPDIVQGGLSPSYVQKFNDLLTGAIARSTASSISSLATRDSYGGISGVY